MTCMLSKTPFKTAASLKEELTDRGTLAAFSLFSRSKVPKTRLYPSNTSTKSRSAAISEINGEFKDHLNSNLHLWTLILSS